MKKIVFLVIVFLCLVGSFFVYHDDFIYSKSIMKITHIKKIKEYTMQNDTFPLEEKYKELEITGVLTNGKNKGDKVTVKYDETFSSVVTEKYRIGDKVFLEKNSIDGLKRDFYLFLMVSFFVIFLYIVGEFKGLLSIFTVILNTLIFCFGLSLYFKGINLLLLCVIESLLFSFISLLLTGGKNKKTLSAIISVFLSTIFMIVLLLVVSKTTNYSGVSLNNFQFLTVPIDDIFLPELVIGGIGAIMDVAITISSSIAELIEKDKNIKVKSLKKSSKEIGKDIMSTMSNVLFFTYLCSGLPIFVLAIRSGFTVSNYISSNFSLELTRFLVGSIGIIMTIPITSYVSIYLQKEVRR